MSMYAQIVRELVAAGLSGDAIADALERIEASIPAKTDDQAERRRAADRERKRVSRLRNSAESAESAEPSSPSLSPVPSPPMIYNSNPPNPTPKPSPTIAAAAPRQRDLAFEEFWKAYPRREGANPKEPARKKFDQALKSGVEFDAIMTGAKAYAASMAGKEPRFVAQAVTWLNQSRWQDDYRPVGAHDPPKVTRLEFFPDGSRVPDRDREPEAFFAAMAEYREGKRGKMNVG